MKFWSEMLLHEGDTGGEFGARIGHVKVAIFMDETWDWDGTLIRWFPWSC